MHPTIKDQPFIVGIYTVRPMDPIFFFIQKYLPELRPRKFQIPTVSLSQGTSLALVPLRSHAGSLGHGEGLHDTRPTRRERSPQMVVVPLGNPTRNEQNIQVKDL